jgi:methyl-accepting chemotaxis protein
MRLSILWKLLVPIVLVVSVLASGLLWVQLHLLDESFHRRALWRLTVATQVIPNEQRDLAEKALLVAESLARDPRIVRALLLHDQNEVTVDLASAASATGMLTIALFDTRGGLFAATWPAHAGQIPPQTVSLVSRALAGTAVTGPVPSWRVPGQIAITAMAPIRDIAQVYGVVVVESVMGNAFVDEVKHLTGLEVGVFLEDRRVVSTNFTKDGRRLVNERTPSRNAHKTLAEGQTTTDEVTAGGRQFISRYIPLRSPAGPIIGMVGVGRRSIKSP